MTYTVSNQARNSSGQTIINKPADSSDYLPFHSELKTVKCKNELTQIVRNNPSLHRKTMIMHN